MSKNMLKLFILYHHPLSAGKGNEPESGGGEYRFANLSRAATGMRVFGLLRLVKLDLNGRISFRTSVLRHDEPFHGTYCCSGINGGD